MNNPRRPHGSDPNQPGWSPPTEPLGDRNPPYTDPAYAGQFSYPSYTPPPDATRELPPYWTQTQYQGPGYPPPGEVPPAPQPERPGSPRWLWVLAGGAVLLVIGLVVAMVIANGSSQRDTAVTPLPPMPEPTGITPPPTTTRTPTTTRPVVPPPLPTEPPTTSAPSGATETVVYSVTGEGRAISITYVDSGAMMQMEFNVALPWSKQVTLSAPASSTASVTVFNVGRDVTCSVTVDGAQVQQRTGSGITMCAGGR